MASFFRAHLRNPRNLRLKSCAYGGRKSQRGAATVYFVLLTLVVLGLMVMATDFGRLYLIQGELQTAADAAAMAAATRLVGTSNSLLHADDQVTSSFDSTTGNDNRFNLRMNQIGVSGGSDLITTTRVDYFSTLLDALGNVNAGQSGGIDWETGLYPKYVRVQITAQAPVVFVPLLNPSANSPPTIAVSAVAGISAPVCSACGIDGLAVEAIDSSDLGDYGFVGGGYYTLYLTQAQRGAPPNQAPPAALAGTTSSVRYVILDHIPSGLLDQGLDNSLFQLGAGGIASSPGLTPAGNISIDAVETGYPDLPSPGTPVGQDTLCGLNVRFGIDPSLICGAAGSEFAVLWPRFSADTDLGDDTDTYVDPTGLQDFVTEYDGNMRRILTMAVVDSVDTLTVLNFRQFLIEPAQGLLGLNTTLATGAFRAQYIGALVPLRCGGIGGVCTASPGVGRVVLH